MQNKTLNEIQPIDKPFQRDQGNSICFTLNERRGILKCCIENKEHAQVTDMEQTSCEVHLPLCGGRDGCRAVWGQGDIKSKYKASK